MFVDSSAIVAILNDEPDAAQLEKRLAAFDGKIYFSALVRYEATLSLARARTPRGSTGMDSKRALIALAREAVDAFIVEIGAEEIAISGDIGAEAINGATAYGKAVGHPADLNFGDCFVYACAKMNGLELLYKGDDFAKTDLGKR